MTARSELDAAGIEGAALRRSYEICRRLNAEHGKTYYLATLLLPPAKRPHVHALYGFARYVDDLVDDLDPSLTPQQRADRLGAWTDDFLADLDWGATSDPVSRAVLHTVQEFGIPHEYLADFLESMRMDLTVTGYPTFADLEGYMWGSAAVIGLEMLPILGRRDESVRWDVIEDHAIDLGVAFQLTNFLRDIAEDLRRGRVYLPQESLDMFGVDRDRLARGVVDESLRNLLAWEIERTRDIYRRAEPGIELVHPSSQDCLRTAFTLYGGILDEIEAADYDVFTTRVAVPLRRRGAVAARGLARAYAARRDGRPLVRRTSTTTTPSAPSRTRTADPRAARRRSARP
ncbi:MAG: phytoene/squalene synthase family protein [Jatrophihabitans sp.]|uniref:phytoene/squalene synthase family protein n=1 Tax=Jatrophihabitans sp. TaxID=1932789 RepID=UPI003F819204